MLAERNLCDDRLHSYYSHSVLLNVDFYSWHSCRYRCFVAHPLHLSLFLAPLLCYRIKIKYLSSLACNPTAAVALSPSLFHNISSPLNLPSACSATDSSDVLRVPGHSSPVHSDVFVCIAGRHRPRDVQLRPVHSPSLHRR